MGGDFDESRSWKLEPIGGARYLRISRLDHLAAPLIKGDPQGGGVVSAP